MVAWKKEVGMLCEAILVLDNESVKIREILENSETGSNEELKKNRNENYYLKDIALKLLYKSSLLEIKGYYSQMMEGLNHKIYITKCFNYEIATVKNLSRKDDALDLGELKTKTINQETKFGLDVDRAKSIIKEFCFINNNGSKYSLDEKKFKERARELKMLKKSPLRKSIDIVVREIIKDEEPKVEFKIDQTKLVEIERIQFLDDADYDLDKKNQLKKEFKEIMDNKKKIDSNHYPIVYKKKDKRKIVYAIETGIETYYALKELDVKKIHVKIIEE